MLVFAHVAHQLKVGTVITEDSCLVSSTHIWQHKQPLTPILGNNPSVLVSVSISTHEHILI